MRGTLEIVHADALAWLRAQPDCSFDALLSDPPYGLSPDGKARTWDDLEALRGRKKRRGFMNKAWDAGVPGPTFWREVLRVLKPGAPILAFGGTRTYHRLTGALEDAGAEIVDCLSWLHGQGFPKSRDISKDIDDRAGAKRKVVGQRAAFPDGTRGARARPEKMPAAYGGGLPDLGGVLPVTAPATPEAERWDGYGTALRPAWEPCVLACKPFDGTIAENALKWGVGGLWIEACRLPLEEWANLDARQRQACSSGVVPFGSAGLIGKDIPTYNAAGRWPPNVLLSEEASLLLDEQSGERPSGIAVTRHGGGGKIFGGIAQNDKGHGPRPDSGYTDAGGASRFFYCAKVSRWEREFGCEHLPLRTVEETVGREEGSAGTESPRAGAGRKGDGVRNHHPTLKPIALTEWLAKLVLPPAREGAPRRLLVPFAGSGSEVIGAMRAGWDEVVAVEREEEYVAILRARVARWREVPVTMTPDQARELAERGVSAEQLSLAALFGRTGT